jgi:hypothetical protein
MHAAAIVGGSMPRERAPPATDVEEQGAGLRPQDLQDAFELRDLRLLETTLWLRVEQRGGIRERPIEPGPVEIIGQPIAGMHIGAPVTLDQRAQGAPPSPLGSIGKYLRV